MRTFFTKSSLALVLSVGILAPYLSASALGTINMAFNPDPTTASSIPITAVAVQSNGKILVAGANMQPEGVPTTLIRYNANGTYDDKCRTEFGTDGDITAIALANNNIYLVGKFSKYINTLASHLVVLNDVDCKIDSQFDTTKYHIPGDPYAVAVQSDGNIVVGGAFPGGIMRINADGTPDDAFNNVATPGFDGGEGTVYSISLKQIDDIKSDIYVGGSFQHYNGLLAPDIIKLHANGYVDTTFDSAMGGGLNGTVRAVYWVPGTDKVLAGGDFTRFDDKPVQGLLRLNVNGKRDFSFVGPIPLSLGQLSVNRIKSYQGGQRHISGMLHRLGNNDTYAARLISDGTADKVFSQGDFMGPTDDGKINDLGVANTGEVVFGGAFDRLGNIPWLPAYRAMKMLKN